MSQGPAAISSPPAPGIPSRKASASGGGMAAAAERLRAARGGSAAAAAPAAKPDEQAIAETVRPAENEPAPVDDGKTNIASWLLPLGPASLVKGGEWLVRKAGREPLAPDPVWYGRFRENYHKTLEQKIPKLNVSPWTALLVASVFLVISMWWGAKKRKKDDAATDAKPAADAPAAPGPAVPELAKPALPAPASSPPASATPSGGAGTTKGPSWETLAPSPSPAGSLFSAASSDAAGMSQLSTLSSSPADSSGDGGSVGTAAAAA